MKKLLTYGCLILGIIFFSNTNALAQSDAKVGGGLIYGSEIENLGLRLDGYYPINEKFRAGAALGYFFPEDVVGGDITWFEIDFNGNYIFYSEEEMDFYGLAGLNFLIASFNPDQGDSDSDSELGLNLGAGIEYHVDFGSIFGELKFAGVGGDADQLVLGAGVRFGI